MWGPVCWWHYSWTPLWTVSLDVHWARVQHWLTHWSRWPVSPPCPRCQGPHLSTRPRPPPSPALSADHWWPRHSLSKSSVSPQSENRESIGWECRKTTRRYQCPAGPFYTRFLAKLCLKFVIYIRNMYICMMSWYWMLNEINLLLIYLPYLLWYRIIFHTCRI